MQKIKLTKNVIAIAVLCIWAVAVAYFVSTDQGRLKGQMFSAPKTCDEILSDLQKQNPRNVTELVDAALQKDCVVTEDLLNSLEQKLIEEQVGEL